MCRAVRGCPLLRRTLLVTSLFSCKLYLDTLAAHASVAGWTWIYARTIIAIAQPLLAAPCFPTPWLACTDVPNHLPVPRPPPACVQTTGATPPSYSPSCRRAGARARAARAGPAGPAWLPSSVSSGGFSWQASRTRSTTQRPREWGLQTAAPRSVCTLHLGTVSVSACALCGLPCQ